MAAEKMSIPFELDTGTDWAEQVLCAGSLTLGEKTRKTMKNDQLRKQQKETCSRALCGLLNSGGGVIKAEIQNPKYEFNSDGLGLDLETSFHKIVSFIPKYLDFEQKDSYFYIFVKSWTPDSYDQHIVTITTNLYERNLSFSDNMNGHAAVEFLRDMKRQGGRLSSRPTEPHVLDVYFNKTELTYEDEFPFFKSTHVEVKLSFQNNIPTDMKFLPRTVSAFANTDGGYLFIGIDGKKQRIIGFKAEKNDLKQLKSTIEKCIDQLPVYHFCEEKKGIKYEVRFIEVHDRPGSVHSYVCALRVDRFCCAVFAEEPDSWHVEEDCVKTFSTEEWVTRLMNDQPGVLKSIEESTPQSSMLPYSPCSRNIYDYLENQQQSYELPVPSGKMTCIPEALCRELFQQHEGLQQLIQKEMDSLHEGTLIFSKSWSLDLGLRENPEVICDVLLIALFKLPTLYTIVRVDEELEDDLTVLKEPSSKLKYYSKQTALTLKQAMVNVGGYTGKVGILIKILYLSHKAIPPYDSSSKVSYPESYNITTKTMGDLLTALLEVLTQINRNRKSDSGIGINLAIKH